MSANVYNECGFYMCTYVCVCARADRAREQDRHAEREAYCKLATSDLASRIFLSVEQQHVVIVDST